MLGVGPTQHCRWTSTGVRLRVGPLLYPGRGEWLQARKQGFLTCVYSGVCDGDSVWLWWAGVGSDSWAPASMIGCWVRGPQSRSRSGVTDREVDAGRREFEELLSSKAWVSGKPSTVWVAVGFWK